MRTTIQHRPGRRHHRHLLIAVLGVAALTAACGTSGQSGTTSTVRSSTPSTATPNGSGGVTSTSQSGTGTTPATAALTSALTSTYQTETAALATYRNVVAALGAVGPFPNVITSEQQHASTVSALFTRYGIALPAPGTGQSSPATRTAACALGVSVEQQLIALYGAELPKVAAYPDVTTAFQNLLTASRDDHLPAFQHCA